MEDRAVRLQLMYTMFERTLKRELTPEERRLLALSDLCCQAEDGDLDSDLPALGKTAS